jgi:hypothetical protein
MINGKNPLPGVFVLCMVLVLSSCTDFFSTSLAPWAKRDPSSLIPGVNAGNVQDLISQTESDPDLSLAVLKGIQEALKGTTDPDEKTVLRNAALQAATNASGLGGAFLANAGEIVKTLNHPDELKTTAINAINNMTNLDEVTDILLNGIIPPPASDPVEFVSFIDGAPATDLALSSTVLLLGEAQKLGSTEAIEGYITGTGPGPHFDFDHPSTDGEKLAVELAKETIAIVDDPQRNAPKELKDILENLGFTSNRP